MATMASNSILHESPAKYFQWRIPHFFELSTESDYSLDSTSFSLSNAKWFLRIRPNYKKLTSVSIELSLMRNESMEEHRVACIIGINGADGSDVLTKTLNSTFPKQTGHHGSSVYINNTTLCSVKKDVAPDGTLTVFCALRILDRPFTLPVNLEAASQTHFDSDLLISSLLEDFKNLYINRRCTDVTLIVKSEEFYAHKTILIARSSVFASMFEHNLSEKSSGKIEIPDCDPSSFEKFLIFLYTGKLDNVSWKAAMDLYKTADKYDVRTMKLECVHIMRRDLCVDFFCDAIHLATMYMESDLLKDATNFFIDNAEAVLLTTKWQQFLEENSSLCNELLLKLLKSKNLRKDKV